MAATLRGSTATPRSEAHRRPAEFALACLGVELMVAEGRQDHAYVPPVFLRRLREDEDVVHVHLDEVPEHRLGEALPRRKGVPVAVEGEDGPAENLVHVAHEQRGHAVKPERAHSELVLPTGDAKRGLVLVPGADAELMIAGGQVELGEVAGATCLVNQLIHVRERFH